MKRFIGFLFLFVFVCAGCGTAPIRPMSDANRGMVYGLLWTPLGAPSDIQIFEVGKFGGGDAHVRPYDNGMFIGEDIKAGKYYFAWCSKHNSMFQMSDFKNDYFEVKPGQVLYLGSYQLKVTSTGDSFSSGKFDLKKLDKPGPIEILKDFLELPEWATSDWASLMKKEIKRLKNQ